MTLRRSHRKQSPKHCDCTTHRTWSRRVPGSLNTVKHLFRQWGSDRGVLRRHWHMQLTKPGRHGLQAVTPSSKIVHMSIHAVSEILALKRNSRGLKNRVSCGGGPADLQAGRHRNSLQPQLPLGLNALPRRPMLCLLSLFQLHGLLALA